MKIIHQNSEIKEMIIKLSEKYSNLESIEIDYNGSGDSFESMYSNTNNVEEEDYQDIVWKLIEMTEADFNNEGSEGNIIIDLVNKTASIKNYYIIYEKELSDDITVN